MPRMTSRVEDGEYNAALDRDRRLVEERLTALLDERAGGPGEISRAVRYMVLDAGKRLRPILCLWTHDALGGANRDACLDAACAIECLHTYSLIHDDLPCMDDDDLRRGRPSCHKKYGEAIAVLAGDALLTLCFDIMGSMGDRWDITPAAIIDALNVVTKAAGTGGLIGGQVRDISSDTSSEFLEPHLDVVNKIHREKTAALIAASMETGAVIAGAGERERERIRSAGVAAGRAFQIIDDVLDIETDADTLGKTPGKDARDGKLTYPSVVGVAASREKAVELIAEAGRELGEGRETRLLLGLFEFLVSRRA